MKKELKNDNSASKVKTFFVKLGKGIVNIFKTVGRWLYRAFMGPSAVLAREESKRRKQALAEQENNSASNLDRVDGQVLCDVDDKSYNDTVCDNAVNADEATDIDDKTNKKRKKRRKNKKQDDNNVEEIVSPFRQIFKNFFGKRLAVTALVILILMFGLAFIGPLCMPKYSDTYSEFFHLNQKPGFKYLKIPKELASDVKYISTWDAFSAGLSNSGKVYVWGNTDIGASGIDVGKIPDEVKNADIKFVGAGEDHVVAIGSDGKIYCWGKDDVGQLGKYETTELYYEMPAEIRDGVNINEVSQLVVGHFVTAIVMKDGKVYMWGAKASLLNFESIAALTNVEKLVFEQSYAVALLKDGTISTGDKNVFKKVYLPDGTKKDLDAFTRGRKIVDLAANQSCVALVLSDGTIGFGGTVDEKTYTTGIPDGEKITQLVSGQRHFVALTDAGKIYTWGSDILNQTKMPKASKLQGTDTIYAGAFASYAVKDGKVLGKWGWKGYLFGTDASGRSILQRSISGGKMTMTVGAVAVLISTVIGIVIGIISGYFGGWVDMFLMRVCEIVSAIPFLPFAMILSSVMLKMDITNNQKIVLIMVILGVLTWPGLARLVRGQVLAEREKEFVTAAKAMGVREGRIAFKHILPNVISVILVSLTLDFAGCLLTESSLSYLGFGVQQPSPTWGNMLDMCKDITRISNYWWQWLFPALLLATSTICINIIGDTLRDVMDPKSNIDK
ncbi:MAG: ABC transporter permease subunit [Christensenellales bacterium]